MANYTSGKDSSTPKAQPTLLGRTALSWAKILGYYCVYYSILACLSYTYIHTYQGHLPVPGEGGPKIRSRTDMPGAAVYPFNSIENAEDGDNNIVTLSTDIKKEQSKLYISTLEEFVKTYTVADSETSANKTVYTCTDTDDITSKTCKVPNSNFFKNETIKDSVLNMSPYVTIALNKVINWHPLNKALWDDQVSKDFTNSQDFKFIKNAVYFDCYESDISGAHIEEKNTKDSENAGKTPTKESIKSNFNVDLVGIEKMILPKYFPYLGLDMRSETNKIPYLKPFVIAQVKSTSNNETLIKEHWGSSTHYFRCNIDADNIQSPRVGLAFENNPEDKGWSNDLSKLVLGYVQFGIKYV